jgi:hypothetical protein
MHVARPAVLFLVFNRPDTTSRVFEALRRAKPPRLYVAADGPRPDRQEEPDLCTAVRRIATRVDWPCELRTRFQDSNQGCKLAVSGAISWFFDNEEQGIIIEDDCLPTQGFFGFCEELLRKYRNDERIMTIGGVNFQRGIRRSEASYFVSKHFHCWGWASWRRAWAVYDRDLERVEPAIFRGLELLSDGSRLFPFYWRRVMELCRSGYISTWDYPFLLSCFALNGSGRQAFHIAPQVNLVANVGFGPGGTHTVSSAGNLASQAFELEQPIRHPALVERNVDADRVTDRAIMSWSRYLKLQLGPRFPGLRRLYRLAMGRG